MPIYEYQCNACGHQLEAFQKMSESPLIECPECNKDALQKLVSAAGFQLKGTGWYATDYRNNSKTESSSSAPKTTSSDQSTNDSPKSDTSKSDSGASSSTTTDSGAKGDKT